MIKCTKKGGNNMKKQTICPICNNKLSFLKSTIKDGVKVCAIHTVSAGLILNADVEQATVEEIKERLNTIETKQKTETEKLVSFKATKEIGAVKFNAIEKQMLIQNNFKNSYINYKDIISFELIEDDKTVSSGGLSRALVGGVLFGGAGAIVGAVTAGKKKKYCEKLLIKMTINDMNDPVLYIPLITNKTKIDSDEYKKAYNEAQELLSTFQIICN